MPRITTDLIEVFPFRRVAGDIEFLMLRRAADEWLGGTWHAVHGRVEPDETALAAALRELREETGLRPMAFWQVDFVSTYYVATNDTVYLQPTFAAETPPDAAVQLSDEHDAQRWIPSDRAAEAFLWPNQRRAVRSILDEILGRGPAEPFLRLDM